MHTDISTIAYEGSPTSTSIGSTITQSRTTGGSGDHYSFPTLPYLEGFYLDSNGTGSRLDISTTSSLVSYNITTSSTRTGSFPYTYTWNVLFTNVRFADNLESEILAVKRPDGSDLKPDTKLVYTGSLTSYASNTTSYAMYSFVPRVHDTVYAVWRWSTTYPSTTTITSHSASIRVQKDNYPGWDIERGNTPLNQYV